MEGLRDVADAVNDPKEALHPALEKFCRDVRETLEGGSTPAQLVQVKEGLQVLLRDASFLDRYCSADAKPGLHLLYEDSSLGFQVLAHVNDKGRVSPPHNHGDSWAIYGQGVGHTDMTEWERVVDCVEPPLARMVATTKYRLLPGDAGLFPPGVIHSIDYPAETRFIRVTGVNLDAIQRSAFDPLTASQRTLGPAPAGAA